MTDETFQAILTELRAHKADHQRVEAKRAGSSLPATIYDTLSAFANAEGGIVLLGVDESGGRFNVTGVDDPARIQQALQAACAEMEPALRPIISLNGDPAAQVVVATVPPVPPTQRPCHRGSLGPYDGSYIRVGDADQRLSRVEVDEMLAHRSGYDDFSAKPAPSGAALSATSVAMFIERVQAEPGSEGLDVAGLLHRWRVTTEENAPTLAGVVAIGDNPAGAVHAARVAYRVLPVEGDPPDARFSGEHLEGTVGELLDQIMRRFDRDLRPFQVMRGGALRDDLEVPREALREIISNALLHRSFTPALETRTIAIEISEAAVVITSPGGLHTGADLKELGLAAMSGVRNLALVRICEKLVSPTGARLIENQSSGIASADRACHEAGAMPPLFVDLPDKFQAILLRRSPSRDRAAEVLGRHGLELESDLVRVTAVALALDDLRNGVPGVPLGSIALDGRLVARILAPRMTVDAVATLLTLEAAGVLRRRVTRYLPYWTVAEPEEDQTPVSVSSAQTKPVKGRRGDDRIPDLISAIAQSADGRLAGSEIGTALNLTSSRSRAKWINTALDKGLVESSTDNLHDPTRTYSLTRSGRELLRRLTDRSEPGKSNETLGRRM